MEDSTEIDKKIQKEAKPLKGRKAVFYLALQETLGNVTAAERKTGVDRTTHYLWIHKDPNYKLWVERLPELIVDFYEQALNKSVNAGNITAIIFALKSKGKHRGWIEAQQIEHTGIGYTTIEAEITAAIEGMEDNKKLDETPIQE